MGPDSRVPQTVQTAPLPTRSPAAPARSPVPLRPHLAGTAAALAVERRHALRAHQPCRVPARWLLSWPQAPRSALPRGGERTGRRHWPGWGPEQCGQRRGRSAVRGKSHCSAPRTHCSVQTRQLRRELCRAGKRDLSLGSALCSGAPPRVRGAGEEGRLVVM